MSELSGNLNDFPLPEVLRLLSRSQTLGVLNVYGDVVRGRIYLNEGKISYATTRSTDDFAEGVGTESRLDSDRRTLQLDEVGNESPELFTDFLRLQIIEVLVRLGRETTGSFVFQAGETPQEAIKEPFPVDEILAGAEAELKEWHRIEAIIGTTSQLMSTTKVVDEGRSISLSGSEWNILGVLASTATTRDVGESLQMFEIVAGRSIARLVEEGLVQVAEVHPKAAPTDTASPTTQVAPSERGGRTSPDPGAGAHSDADGSDLSQRETQDLISALSHQDEKPSRHGFEGLEDEPEVTEAPSTETANTQSHPDDQPPASELARRWRDLRAGAAEQ